MKSRKNEKLEELTVEKAREILNDHTTSDEVLAKVIQGLQSLARICYQQSVRQESETKVISINRNQERKAA